MMYGSIARSHSLYLTDLLGFHVCRGSAVELIYARSTGFTICGSASLLIKY